MNPAAYQAGERANPGAAVRRSASTVALDSPRAVDLNFMLHDSPQEFRIVITGDLAGRWSRVSNGHG